MRAAGNTDQICSLLPRSLKVMRLSSYITCITGGQVDRATAFDA